MSATAKRYVPKAQRKPYRNQLYAKLHALWSQLRTDLTKGSQEYKDALYTFAEQELKIARIGSMTELSDAQLGRLLDVLEREAKQPRLYREEVQSPESGVRRQNVLEFTPKTPDTGLQTSDSAVPVEHLASLEQAFAINRLFGYLGWGDYGREQFLNNKFRTREVRMLTKKHAHNCINILLRCAASKYWKAEGKDKVSDPMIRAAIPVIKKQIGIE